VEFLRLSRTMRKRSLGSASWQRLQTNVSTGSPLTVGNSPYIGWENFYNMILVITR